MGNSGGIFNCVSGCTFLFSCFQNLNNLSYKEKTLGTRIYLHVSTGHCLKGKIVQTTSNLFYSELQVLSKSATLTPCTNHTTCQLFTSSVSAEWQGQRAARLLTFDLFKPGFFFFLPYCDRLCQNLGADPEHRLSRVSKPHFHYQQQGYTKVYTTLIFIQGPLIVPQDHPKIGLLWIPEYSPRNILIAHSYRNN